MQITREDLYKLVSEAPLSKVAPGLGIPATALSALCKKHNVPFPGSGHWTRLSLGLPALLPPLPRMETESSPVEILPAPVRAKRPAHVVKVKVVEDGGAAKLPVPQETHVQVAERLSKPHPLVAGWLADHERETKEAARSRDPWRVRNAPPPWTSLDRRRHRLLDALFKAVEKRGGAISKGEKGTVKATINSEAIEFLIREKTRQVKVAPEDSRSSYLRTDLVGTGKLVIAVRTYLRGSHNEEWRDSDRTPLEDQLPAFVDRLFEGAEILKAWRIERELESERWRQEAARRAEIERLKKQDEKRQQGLLQFADQLETVRRLRALIDQIKSKPFEPSATVGDRSLETWLAWAESYVEQLLEPMRSAEALFSHIDLLRVEKGWSQY